MKRIISVANRLPVTIGRNIKKSSGGLVSALAGVEDSFSLKWVGWPGCSIKSSKRAEVLEEKLKNDYDCIPVFLTQKEVASYYEGFSNSSLWPLLHYMTHYVRHDESWWDEYQKVNIYFADKVLKTAKKGDIVWVHDYHLMLLPKLLRKRRKDLKIGFFLHTPFPSYEVFRCHPHRRELLEGLLGSDLIGFHTFGYMRHFRSSVMRLLGIESDMNCIPYDGRHCQIGVYPIGANAKAFSEEIRTKRFELERDHLKQVYRDRKIVLSVERLDYTKGISRRLDAIEHYLSRCSDRENICFIFVAIPSRGEVQEYQELREMVEGQVGRINGKYATLENSPVHFIHQSVDFTRLCAMYSLADVAMVTPLIDGMNLVAKEYVVCKEGRPGVLLLSEFAGAASELFKAVKVNPYDVDDMAEKIEEALHMPVDEQMNRMQGMYERVMEYDAPYWAKTFLRDLEHYSVDTVKVAKPQKSETVIAEKFKNAGKVACFLDYDGTLREFQDDPKKASPTKSIYDLIKLLDANENIDTFIISGRKAENLEEWFADYNCTLIAEHGYRYRLAGSKQWEMLSESFDVSWKDQVIQVLNQHVGTTPGSFVEEKISAVVWHYRRSDPEFGKWKAQHLTTSLYEMLTNLPVEVHHGKKIVEVSSMQVNKGAAIEKLTKDKDYDLIFCAGDDQTDESMFRLEKPNMLRVKVGKGDTKAQLRIGDPATFRRVMKKTIRSLG